MGKFKAVTHWIAGIGGVALGWAVSPQGQKVIGGVVSAYPKASFLTVALGFLSVLYHDPTKG